MQLLCTAAGIANIAGGLACVVLAGIVCTLIADYGCSKSGTYICTLGEYCP
ncbi:MAG: halocin C8-like domain-containing protein [Methanosarcina sp.]|jgi:halocin C8-like bacteriocin domain-containing protein